MGDDNLGTALVHSFAATSTASRFSNFSPEFLSGVLFAPHNGLRTHTGEMRSKALILSDFIPWERAGDAFAGLRRAATPATHVLSTT